MAKKRTFSENKKNIIASLIEEYDIQTAADVQEALKDLLGGTMHIPFLVNTSTAEVEQ